MTITVLALTALCVALLASWLRSVATTNAAHQRERDQWVRERQLLLNRIKPETAQYVPDPDAPVPSVRATRFDDDDDYWRAVDPTESREELADRMMAEELNGAA